MRAGARQCQKDQSGKTELHAKLRDINKSTLLTFEELDREGEKPLRPEEIGKYKNALSEVEIRRPPARRE